MYEDKRQNRVYLGPCGAINFEDSKGRPLGTGNIVVLWYPQGAGSRILPWIPKLKDVQVPYIK